MLFAPWLPSRNRKHGSSHRTPRPSIYPKTPLALELLEARLVPSSNQEFVQQAFLDVLHRPVDAPSLARLAGALDAGAVSRTDVAGFIVTSPEARVVQTQDLFHRYLLRAADPVGLNTFTNLLLTGGSQEQAAAVLLGSAEYFTNRGGNSNEGFLEALYQDTLGRPVDPTGQRFFGAVLSLGVSREALAGYVLTSPEYQADLVQGFFQTLLHRPAEDSAVHVFASALAAGVRDEVVMAFIVASQEYFDHATPAHQPPTVTLTAAAANPTNVAPIPVTAAFSKSVTGFTQGAIQVTNATLSNFTGSGATYTFDLTPAGQGLVTVDIPAGVAQDAAGNANTAATPLRLVFDNIAPAVPTIVSATNGILTGTAEAGSSVAVVLDGTLLGTIPATNTGTWSFNYSGTALSNGNHTFIAMAADAAGNWSVASAGFVLTVFDITPPPAPSLAFSNGTLFGTAEAHSTVKVFNGATLVVTVAADATGAWTATPTLANGTYHFTATATDGAGNTSPASREVVVTLPSTAPAAPSIALHGGTLSGTAEPGSTVQVFQDGALVATLPTAGTGAWSFTPTVTVGSTYQFTATATNAAGNTSPASSEVLLTVDPRPPATPSLAFGKGMLSGTADPGKTVDVFNGSKLVVTATADGSGVWTATPTLADGTYPLTAIAVDAAGNASRASSEVIVTIDSKAPDAPSLAYSRGTLSGTAAPGSTVQVSNGSTVLTTQTADPTGAWSWTPTLADGTYHFTATATDAAGNTRKASSEVIVVIDTTAPNPPSLTYSKGTLSGTAEPTSIVQVFEENTRVAILQADRSGAWSVTLTFPADGTYHLTATATDAADNTSPAASPLAITIDITPPTSVITFPADSSFLGAGSWQGSITGTASDSRSGVQQVAVSIQQTSTGLYWDGTAFASASEVFLPVTGTTAWSLSFPATNFPTTDTYTVHSQATDGAGNVETMGSMNTFAFTAGPN